MKVKIVSPAPLRSLKTICLASNVSAHLQLSVRGQYHVWSRSHKPSPRTHPPSGAVGFVSHTSRSVSYEQKAKDLNQQGVDEALSDFDTAVGEDQEKQQRAPCEYSSKPLPF